jgi:hypothetical protein
LGSKYEKKRKRGEMREERGKNGDEKKSRITANWKNVISEGGEIKVYCPKKLWRWTLL